MSSQPIPLVIEDVSQFARALRKLWPEEPPGHANMLGLVAKAAGYRNHQTLKADLGIAPPEAPLSDLEQRRLRDALRVFDLAGHMTRWPQKTMVQGLCLAAFWAALPARRHLEESEVNACIKTGEVFGDHVLIRRALIEHNMVTRDIDGRNYRRVERRPSPLERLLIRAISERKLANIEAAGQV